MGIRVAWNATFKDRMEFYGVGVRLCRFYRAQTKGKVESGVKYVRRNALAGRCFRDLDDLNAYLLDWCVSVADQRVHGTTHEKPQERSLRAETLEGGNISVQIGGKLGVLLIHLTPVHRKPATGPCRAAYTSYPLLQVNNRPVQPVFERTATEEPMP